MKLVYVAHPLGSGRDREMNRASASRFVARIAELGFAPVADARTWGVRVYDYTGVAPEALTYCAIDPQWSEV